MAKASFKKTTVPAAKTRTRATAADPAEAVSKPRVAVDPITANARAISGASEVADVSTGPKVMVKVPKAFKLTDDGHVVHEYAVGTYEMPQPHAEHPYSAANGVEILE